MGLPALPRPTRPRDATSSLSQPVSVCQPPARRRRGALPLDILFGAGVVPVHRLRVELVRPIADAGVPLLQVVIVR